MPARPVLQPGDALVVVDVQRDFLPGGALPVAHGDDVVPALDRWIAAFVDAGLPVVATRDWHPPGHCSFRERGGPWPRHCVQGTPGAEPPRGLRLPPSTIVVHKGTEADCDAYSGFQGTDLEARLRAAGVRRLYVGGLATDYCVLETVKDALARGWPTMLCADAVRAVDAVPGDGRRAEAEMVRRGATPVRLDERPR
jgi:nicotinamidase/pyrazinamidase